MMTRWIVHITSIENMTNQTEKITEVIVVADNMGGVLDIVESMLRNVTLYTLIVAINITKER